MKLLWVKTNNETLVGESEGRLSAAEGLANPMVLQYINMPAPGKVIGPNGKQPQIVTGFKFITIPCSEIIISRVDYCGEIKKHDPVFITYYQLLEAVKKQAEEPLMVAQ